MKGVSSIIATLLMVVITVALTGTVYAYLQGSFGSITQGNIEVIDITFNEDDLNYYLIVKSIDLENSIQTNNILITVEDIDSGNILWDKNEIEVGGKSTGKFSSYINGNFPESNSFQKIKVIGNSGRSSSRVIKIPTYIEPVLCSINNPFRISTAEEFNNIRNDLSGNYILTNDIDLSSYTNWNPIGDDSNRFKGNLDGNNKKINGLEINRNEEYVGLFSVLDDGSKISNLNVEGVVYGGNLSGIITGYNYGTIENCLVSGILSGNTHLGGITGYNYDVGLIKNSYSRANIQGTSYIGGLIGVNIGVVENSYFTGSVSGISYLGGIAGNMFTRDTIISKIINSYSIGQVSNNLRSGGIVGRNRDASITNTYWNTETSGQSTSAGGIGKTTSELQVLKTSTNLYSNWSNSIWEFSTSDYPVLKIFN